MKNEEKKGIKKIKVGLDFDGVITAKPELFSILSKLLVDNGHEVHILTGNRGTPEFLEGVLDLGIVFTHFFSISDHHRTIGTDMTGYDQNSPWIDDLLWNKTKGWYCKQNEIDLHIDDSKDYGQHFLTSYCLFQD